MILSGESESHAFGLALASKTLAGDVITLSGPLGAGKTSIARGILNGLGFAGEVPSPSFPIVINYDPPLLRLPVWHVDLYRLDHPEAIEELGLDEVLSDGALIIEWPERLGQTRWPNMLEITLEMQGDDRRALTASPPASWEGRWPL